MWSTLMGSVDSAVWKCSLLLNPRGAGTIWKNMQYQLTHPSGAQMSISKTSWEPSVRRCWLTTPPAATFKSVVFLGCLSVFERRMIEYLRKIDSFWNDGTSFHLIEELGFAFHSAVRGALCVKLAVPQSHTLGTAASVADLCSVLLVNLWLACCLKSA